jgi:hypothetical protein
MKEIIKNEIIKIENLQIELSKDFLTNPENIKKIQDGIKALEKNVYDLSTESGIKEAKELKTRANKFLAKLKEFCDPLEADGKKIAEIRSSISTKLITGKDSVIDKILAPVYLVEDKIRTLQTKRFIASLNAQDNLNKINEIESLKDFNWLAYKDEALTLLGQHKTFLDNEKIKFDKEAEDKRIAEENARLEREEKIRADAKEKADNEAKKAIEEANRRAEQAEQDAKRKLQQEADDKAKLEAKQKADDEAKAKDIENQKKVHNEILEDLQNVTATFEDERIGYDNAKAIIKAIAQGKIRNLKITY